ncbi:hypothetical protein F5146DRAFT_517826 [Armillaria mellea]|nr:hypothetical protein F5146DRAFT_517826 [Armillaria mellea]
MPLFRKIPEPIRSPFPERIFLRIGCHSVAHLAYKEENRQPIRHQSDRPRCIKGLDVVDHTSASTTHFAILSCRCRLFFLAALIMTFPSTPTKRLHYRSFSSRRARRAPTDENIRHHCTRCSFSTNYRSCFVAHEQKFHPARPRVVRTCKDAPYCSFKCSDPGDMVRHRRLFHRPESRPFVVITPESMALGEAIAGLTNLAIGQAGPSLHDPVSSMDVDEDFNA